jgi:transcription elongation factor GreA
MEEIHISPEKLEELKERHQELRDRIQEADKDEEALPLVREEAEKLKKVIENAKIIDPEEHDQHKVGLGALVRVRQENNVNEFEIVDSIEADPREGKISRNSPIGGALMGKRSGEKVKINSKKKIELEIIEIEY